MTVVEREEGTLDVSASALTAALVAFVLWSACDALPTASASPVAISPAATPTAPAPSASRFAGRYRWVGGDGEIRALDDAIESVVGQMNYLIRGLARSRLRKANIPSEELVLVVGRDTITVARPGRASIDAPADGTVIEWRAPDGDRFEVRQGLADGRLYQRFEDARSNTVNRFTLDDRGGDLTVETTIIARQLPAPLRFRTTYKRM